MQPPAVKQDRTYLVLMLALTFGTGMVDAIGYIGLDRVFTANLTGNVVILGMAVVGAAGLPLRGPVLALVFFLAGALLGARTLRGTAGRGWTPRTTVNLLAVATGMTGLAVAAAVVDLGAVSVLRAGVISLLALLMGIQAATARGLDVADLPTVVVTSTLTGLVADSTVAGGSNPRWIRRVCAVVLILLGAVVGAAALRVGIWLGFACSAALTLTVAVAGHRLGRPRQAPVGQDVGADRD